LIEWERRCIWGVKNGIWIGSTNFYRDMEMFRRTLNFYSPYYFVKYFASMLSVAVLFL
jgi:hypothetical protein